MTENTNQNIENTNIETSNAPETGEENVIDFSKLSFVSEETPSENKENNPFQDTGFSDTNENTNQVSEQNITTESSDTTEQNNIFEQNNSDQIEQNMQIENPPLEPEAKNLIAELNQMQVEKRPDIQIENIAIQETKAEDKKWPILGKSGIWKKLIKRRAKRKVENMMIAYFIMTISIIAIFIISLYNKYISIAINPIPENQNLLEKMQTITKTISQHTNINDYALYATQRDIMTSTNATNDTKQIIQNKRLNFLHKKDILEKNMEIFVQDAILNAQKLDSIKKEIIKYGFIPKQLFDIIEEKQSTNWVKKRLALMENLRFITAFKAFSYMDSFIQWLANNTNQEQHIVETEIKKLSVDLEKDITIYTNTCFLNPYELSSNCNTIWDFDNYYKIIDTQRDTNTNFIKQLASYIDNKLQESDIPTFSINFANFNPKEDFVEFTIELNTNTQDEIALNKKWILTPHVFILTNLINLLKQSLLVIGEDIKTDQIKTNPKTIKIWSTVFTVNNSSIKLKLPIQKGGQREISDFFNSKY